ncbi:MAG TPA: CocE/NonD family hydrolase [Nitriliruptorales bacterium]
MSDQRVWAEQEPQPPAPTGPGFVRTSRYVEMTDGVRLATDLYLPDPLPEDARLPTVLVLTPYVRSLALADDDGDPALDGVRYDGGGWGPGLARHGFAVMVVENRGAGASFGRRTLGDRPDGGRDDVDIVEWVIGQPWSNGLVGATGISAPGMAALFLLTAKHPAVRAVAPLWTAFDVFAASRPGGTPIQAFVTSLGEAVRAFDQNRVRELMAQTDPATARLVTGLRPVDEDTDGSLLAAAIGEHESSSYVYDDIIAVTYRDERMPTADADVSVNSWSPSRDLPALLASGAAIYCYAGWYDGAFGRDLVNLYATIADTGPHHLIVGPWGHGGKTYASPLVKGVRPTDFDHAAELAAFFDRHLRGDAAPPDDDRPRVRYFTMGEERWRTAEHWPLPSATRRRWSLADHGTLIDTTSSAASSAGTTSEGAWDEYDVDFEAGSGSTSRYSRSGTPVRYPDRAGPDRRLLTYTSDPLEEDLEITGHPVATLHLSADAEDYLVITYLEDVTPDGEVHMVTEGVLRGLFRAPSRLEPPYWTAGPYRHFTRDEASPVAPGKVDEITFDLYPTSWRFRRGHRIRLAIAGADADQLGRVPAEGGVRLRVHRDALRPSSIALPVVA